MLVSDRVESISTSRQLASQARDPAPHYQHSKLGYNYRLSNLLAAVGRGQLASLSSRVEARRGNFSWYETQLRNVAGWQFMPEATYGESNRWLTCGTINPEHGVDQARILDVFERADIECRPVWKPMHLQPLYSDCVCFGGGVDERLFETGVCLPSGSNQTEQERVRISLALRTAFEALPQ